MSKPKCVVCGTELSIRRVADATGCMVIVNIHCPQCGIEYHQVPKGVDGSGGKS